MSIHEKAAAAVVEFADAFDALDALNAHNTDKDVLKEARRNAEGDRGERDEVVARAVHRLEVAALEVRSLVCSAENGTDALAGLLLRMATPDLRRAAEGWRDFAARRAKEEQLDVDPDVPHRQRPRPRPDGSPEPSSGAQLFYVMSLKEKHCEEPHLEWWKPGGLGYTTRLNEAGKFTRTVIDEEPWRYNNGNDAIAVACEVVERLAPHVVRRALFKNLRAAARKSAKGSDE